MGHYRNGADDRPAWMVTSTFSLPMALECVGRSAPSPPKGGLLLLSPLSMHHGFGTRETHLLPMNFMFMWHVTARLGTGATRMRHHQIHPWRGFIERMQQSDATSNLPPQNAVHFHQALTENRGSFVIEKHGSLAHLSAAIFRFHDHCPNSNFCSTRMDILLVVERTTNKGPRRQQSRSPGIHPCTGWPTMF